MTDKNKAIQTCTEWLKINAPEPGCQDRPYLLERGGYNPTTNKGVAVIIAGRAGQKKKAVKVMDRPKPNGIAARVPVGKQDIATIVCTEHQKVTEGYVLRVEDFYRNHDGIITGAEAYCIAAFNTETQEWEAINRELPPNAHEMISTAVQKAKKPNCRTAHWVLK
jgi:hypothetical protein